jgi:hypothetical protein
MMQTPQPNSLPDEALQQAGFMPVDPASEVSEKDVDKWGRRRGVGRISIEEHLAGLWKVLGLGD